MLIYYWNIMITIYIFPYKMKYVISKQFFKNFTKHMWEKQVDKYFLNVSDHFY